MRKQGAIKIANILLGVLLLGSILFAATLIVVKFDSSWINALDRKIVSHYASGYQARLSTAERAIGKDNPKAVGILKALLEDLEPIKKSDRLSLIKQKGFSLLTQLLANEDQWEAVLNWTTRWVEFNDRDLNAQLRRRLSMWRSPAKKEQGMILLSALHQSAPEIEVISKAYIEALREEGRDAQALSAFGEYLNTLVNPAEKQWQIFWDTGKGFDSRQSLYGFPTISESNVFTYRFGLPAGTRTVRIDPPSNTGLYLQNIALEIKGDDQRKSYPWKSVPLDRLLIRSQGMFKVSETYVLLQTQDPYFHLRLPVIHAVENFGVTLRADAFPNSSKWATMQAAYFLSRPDLYQLLDALSESQRSAFEQIRQVVYIKNFLLESANPTLYWKASHQAFINARGATIPLVLNLARTGNAQCDTVISVDADVSQLKLVLPDANGVAYTFESIEAVGPDFSLNTIMMGAPFVEYHQITMRNGRYVASGKNPFVSMRLPEGQVSIHSVRVKGAAQ